MKTSIPKCVSFIAFICFQCLTWATDTTSPSQSYLVHPLPSHWEYEPQYIQTVPTNDSWWKSFKDTTLNSLIQKAVSSNFNIKAAAKRIEIAKKQCEITSSGYWPVFQTSASWQTSQNSGATSNPKISPIRSRSFSLGLNMQWEIDVFGRISAQLKSDKSNVNLTAAQYDAAMVSLCANLAKTYVQLRTYQTQRAVALRHLASQQKILKIAEARYEAGIGGLLEVAQAKVVVLSTEAQLPGLESLISRTANAIAVLLGEYPINLTPQLLKASVLPHNPTMPDLGIPADLIRRRPDIMEAEAQLAVTASQIGIAKKDFLPTLAITGNIGSSARKLNNLFGSNSMDYSIVPALSWTIFEGFARTERIANARLQMEEEIDNYNFTVINAIQEVDNALSQYRADCAETEAYGRLMEEGEKELQLALDRYKEGLVAYRDVADAQTTFQTYQNSMVESQGAQLASLITLYESLGGGF